MTTSAKQTLGATILFVIAYILALFSNAASIEGDHVAACNLGIGVIVLLAISVALFATRKSPGVAINSSAVAASN